MKSVIHDADADADADAEEVVFLLLVVACLSSANKSPALQQDLVLLAMVLQLLFHYCYRMVLDNPGIFSYRRFVHC